MEKEMYKYKRSIKIFMIVFGVLFVAYLVYGFLCNDLFMDLLIFGFFLLSILVFTIVTVVRGVKIGKKYRNNLIATKPKQRFKYIDSFYYAIWINSGDVKDPSRRQMCVYDIIQDLDTNKYYAIAEQNTNMRLEIKGEKTKLLRIDDIDGVSTRKDWKEANYNDEGSLWLDCELPDCYKNDGTYIYVKYYGEDHKVRIDSQIFNRDSNNDISLLDKSTFILGYAALDTKE